MAIGDAVIAIFLCMGAAQGIVYGFIFLRNQTHNRTAYQFLAATLFFLSYRLVVETLRLFGIGYYDTWYHLMIEYNWIYGALIYFSVKSLVSPQFKLRQRDALHLIPVALQIAISIFVRSQNFYWDGTRESLSWLGYWGYVAWMNYPTKYVVASLIILVYVYQSAQLLRQPSEKVEIIPENAAWIRRMLLLFGGYFVVVLGILLTDLITFDPRFYDDYYYFTRFYYYPFFVGVAFLTYWLGIAGFHTKDRPPHKVKPLIPAEEKARLSSLAHRLQKAMAEQRYYSDPLLSLALLASHLDTKPYLLSKCLKWEMKQKFNDYINGLRIEELKRLLQNPQQDRFTLLGLALDAGFNSKASFNRAVKKHLGISPSELKAQIIATRLDQG